MAYDNDAYGNDMVLWDCRLVDHCTDAPDSHNACQLLTRKQQLQE
jgi:hypothetical protein